MFVFSELRTLCNQTSPLIAPYPQVCWPSLLCCPLSASVLNQRHDGGVYVSTRCQGNHGIHQEREAAGHTAPAVRKQRRVLVCSLLLLQARTSALGWLLPPQSTLSGNALSDMSSGVSHWPFHIGQVGNIKHHVLPPACQPRRARAWFCFYCVCAWHVHIE